MTADALMFPLLQRYGTGTVLFHLFFFVFLFYLMSLFLAGSVLIWFLATFRQTGTGSVMGLMCPVMCLRDDRREECVIVLLTFFKEINMIFFLYFGPPMGMSVPAHLFCRILSGGEDIVLLMLLNSTFPTS